MHSKICDQQLLSSIETGMKRNVAM
ncbi:hypothetical protein QN277_025068 [Acacia crassicarpa]|uniref:Uncharacterized protein n=1 Tax=Acacia crassicarpa TaxID=499986 RepID=A0AAE1MNT7_9FABA|nr:hypothetical protein QN277_025068 [Acacia crassicarpa]